VCYSSVDLVFFATIWFTYDKVSYVKIRAYDTRNIIRMIRMLELWLAGWALVCAAVWGEGGTGVQWTVTVSCDTRCHCNDVCTLHATAQPLISPPPRCAAPRRAPLINLAPRCSIINRTVVPAPCRSAPRLWSANDTIRITLYGDDNYTEQTTGKQLLVLLDRLS